VKRLVARAEGIDGYENALEGLDAARGVRRQDECRQWIVPKNVGGRTAEDQSLRRAFARRADDDRAEPT
jgi:hypothetical protein